ncbi:ABC transporter ATP-binding protein [Cellulomonas sp. ES6]|uniref:ABC transporter ATP-binding protein n=1 Tax=Cellulomonas sp. ES6 TaxID=3039384 RepID=UPI0024B6FE85|nr:ABC transporter ATP-binding protein [Cellulomonas sp. ES6]WHP17263.1 ABC transporter ATP-binding protein [Cellulomonas sp. ES6]
MTTPVLELDRLSVAVTRTGTPLLRDVSLSVRPGEVVGLVGESGSGKSMTSLAVMGVLPDGIAVTGGRVLVSGADATATARRSVAHRFAMIFQNPQDSLNPLMRVGEQIARMVRLHQRDGAGADRRSARAEAERLLGRVHIADPARVGRAYPHQLSGGMCQRVMIAMALACRPALLIADEPTTALDVTVQAQILTLLTELADETGCGVLLITHDLGVVAEVCDRVAVLYRGDLVETTGVVELFESPQHEYTRYLVAAGEEAGDGAA